MGALGVVVLQVGVQVLLHLFHALVELLAAHHAEVLVEQRAVQPFDKAVGLLIAIGGFYIDWQEYQQSGNSTSNVQPTASQVSNDHAAKGDPTYSPESAFPTNGSTHDCSVTVDNAYGPPDTHEFLLEVDDPGTPINITEVSLRPADDDSNGMVFNVLFTGTQDKTTTFLWNFDGGVVPVRLDIRSPRVAAAEEDITMVMPRE